VIVPDNAVLRVSPRNLSPLGAVEARRLIAAAAAQGKRMAVGAAATIETVGRLHLGSEKPAENAGQPCPEGEKCHRQPGRYGIGGNEQWLEFHHAS
jgi:hypothetical protein